MIKNSSQFELHSDTLERKRKGERGEQGEEKKGREKYMTSLHIFSFYIHKFNKFVLKIFEKS